MMKAQPAFTRTTPLFTGTTTLLPCQLCLLNAGRLEHGNRKYLSARPTPKQYCTRRHDDKVTTMSRSSYQKQSPTTHDILRALAEARVPRRLFLATTLSFVHCGSSVCLPAEADELESTTTSLMTRLTLPAPGEPRPQTRGGFLQLLNYVFGETSMSSDLYYPAWFAGVWDTTSTLRAVGAPAGYKLFGRPGAYEQAMNDIDSSIVYKSRFIRARRGGGGDDDDDKLVSVADRVYTVGAIAEATMGLGSVLQCTEVSNNDHVAGDLNLTVRPGQADGRVFVVGLTMRARAQQRGKLPSVLGKGLRRDGGNVFDNINNKEEAVEGLWVSETVRQEVRRGDEDGNEIMRRGGNNNNNTMLVKDVETTTVYMVPKAVRKDGLDKVTTEIRAWQRTCSYLDRGDLKATDARGRPIDVRWYELQYKRPKPVS